MKRTKIIIGGDIDIPLVCPNNGEIAKEVYKTLCEVIQTIEECIMGGGRPVTEMQVILLGRLETKDAYRIRLKQCFDVTFGYKGMGKIYSGSFC